ncbi:MAG: nucleoside 2-deoxyribosyltransferase [Spirochaetota bacterium]
MQESKIYIAGPEVFLPNADDVLAHNKALCADYGFIGLSPLDTEIVQSREPHSPIELAEKIFQANCQLIDECDIVIANCNPFRLAIVDDGTSFEIGYAFANQKLIYGHIRKKKPLPEIVQERIATGLHKSGYLIDREGYLLNEDFGNTINLMLEFSILNSGGKLSEGSFEDCLRTIVRDLTPEE